MKKVLLLLLLATLIALPVLAQEQTGRIEGRVETADGAVVVDAQVTIESDSLIRPMTTMTDDRGRFRFPRIPIGNYTIKIEHKSYRTFEQTGVHVGIGDTVTLAPQLQVGDFEDVITISGESPLIDVSSTEVGESITQELLVKLPTPRFPTDLFAITAGNAGGDSDYGSTMGGTGRSNAYKLDGIDVSDPATGTVWVFVNMESIEEMEVLPITGANADVGGFTGAAMNMVTKSGGNEFSGGIAYYYFNEDMLEWNTDDEWIRENDIRESMNNDFTANIGGPILKDNAWFYVNGGLRKRERLLDVQVLTYEYRNTMWKGSAVLSDSMSINGTFHYDNYIREGRGADYNVAPEATFDQEGPNKSFAVNYTWAIDDNNMLDVKFHGWDGYFALIGNGEGPQYYDVDENYYYHNGDGDYRTDRNRLNANVDLTSYMDDFYGDHQFKFGAEWHRGKQSTWWYWDVVELVGGEFDYRYGVYPNFANENVTTGWTFYGLDSWNVNNRLTINAGLRYERVDYEIPDQEQLDGSSVTGLGTVHTFNNWAPRFGFTYKLDEEGTFLLRGSIGRYYEGIFTYMLDTLTPSDSLYQEFVWSGSDWEEVYVEPYADPSVYTVSDDLGGLYADAVTIGVEKEIFANMAVSADYIHREYKNYPVQFDEGRIWEPVEITFEGQTYTVYSREGGSPNYVYRNSDELFSDYDALVLRAIKRYSNNWQLQASLTLSRLYGNAEDLDGYGGQAINSGLEYYTDPNFQINAEGLQYAHRPWNLKINGTYTFPYDLSVSTITTFSSGPYWTPVLWYSGDEIGQNSVEFLAEERGSRHLDEQLIVDVRAEKVFTYDRFRLSLLLDVFNLFNSGTVNDVEYYLDDPDFGAPVSVIQPRYFQVGLRLSF